jgi:two-component system sensor histidine kinase VicK
MCASSERTEVLTDQKSAMERAIEVFSNAKNGLDILTETLSPLSPFASEEAKIASEAYLAIGKRGGRLRLLTKIDEKNVAYCKEIAKTVELRHLEEVKGNFAVSDSEFMSSPTSAAFVPGVIVTIIYSNARSLVEQNRQTFEAFWNRAQPAAERIAEIEEGRPHRQTRIVRGEEVVKFVGSFLSRAAASRPEPHAYGVSDLQSTVRASEGQYFEMSRQLFSQNPGFRVRHITNVQKDNLEGVKRLLGIGYEVRHLDGNRIRFSVSKDEYVEVIHSETPGGTADEIVWSNDPQIIGQATRMFDALWKQSVPAEARIREIEAGVEASTVDVIRDPEDTKALYFSLVEQAQEEILLIWPTANAFHREEKFGIINSIQEAAKRGVKVSILSPLDDAIRQAYREIIHDPSTAVSKSEKWSTMSIRPIPPSKPQEGVTVLVTDRKSSLVIEEIVPSQTDFVSAIGFATYSTTGPMVKSSIRFIERTLEDIDLLQSEQAALEREKRSRKTAELLQDILAHDVRNYNQVTRMTAELVGEQVASDPYTKKMIDDLLKSIDGSTQLVEKAQKIGKVLSEEDVELYPVDLMMTIEDSFTLIKSANLSEGKTIVDDRKIGIGSSLANHNEARVLADDLLDSVFENIYSNAVKYTNSDSVWIETAVEEEGPYWKVSISDQGQGMDDNRKREVFTRYLDSRKGSGLGLSKRTH